MTETTATKTPSTANIEANRGSGVLALRLRARITFLGNMAAAHPRKNSSKKNTSQIALYSTITSCLGTNVASS